MIEGNPNGGFLGVSDLRAMSRQWRRRSEKKETKVGGGLDTLNKGMEGESERDGDLVI